MELLDLIRMAHATDKHLAELSAAISDEGLKREVLPVQDRWRVLGYRVTSHLCGVSLSADAVMPKRRGRRRRFAAAEVKTDSEEKTEGSGS